MGTAVLETAPAADLNRRFGGLARLYGGAGAARIRAAHIVVVGLGGVGSWAAEALARSGVAQLTLVDLDHIAESNINRQIHALGSTLGKAKVQAMRERIADINPACRVLCIEAFVDEKNWPDLAGLQTPPAGSISVIDACDQVKAKTVMAAWALRQHAAGTTTGNLFNFISVGAAGGKRDAHKVDIDDLALVTHDPLLAQLRYRLRKEHSAARQGKIGVSCVFSREAVMQPLLQASTAGFDNASNVGGEDGIDAQRDNSLNCHGYGSVVSVTSTFGTCAAGWTLGMIAGQTPEEGVKSKL